MLTIKAPAKLNLTLEVLGKRPDGMHTEALIAQQHVADADDAHGCPVPGFVRCHRAPSDRQDESGRALRPGDMNRTGQARIERPDNPHHVNGIIDIRYWTAKK